MYDFGASLGLVFNNLLTTLVQVIPRLILASLILLVGILLGALVKSLVTKLLDAVHLTKMIKGSPVERYAPKGEVSARVEEFLGEIARWSVILIFLIAFFNILEMASVAAVLVRFVNYVPQIISAMIIFIIGVLVAGLVESFVKNAIASIDVATGRLIGKIASYTVVVLASLAAISELGIAELFVNTLFIGFVAMLALGFGLALGLGAKDLIADILKQWYHREPH